MAHIKYSKIHRLGKDEVTGILDGPVTVQEKIDGANVSIWVEKQINDTKNPELKEISYLMKFGSRNNEVPDFRGLAVYARKHEGINKLLSDSPHFRLFGEFLVKHTIGYDETSYRHFYLFDILNQDTNEWLNPAEVRICAQIYNIKHPWVFFEDQVVTEEQIKEVLGKSTLGPKGEGVVIKNAEYTSRFGVKPQYAKLVTQEFVEANVDTFGGNNKSSEWYNEQYISNTFMTLGRVKKIMQKIESAEDRPLQKSDTPTIASTAYHDMLEEEIWSIQKKIPTVNFRQLKKICCRKAVKIFHDILEQPDEVSVAYE